MNLPKYVLCRPTKLVAGGEPIMSFKYSSTASHPLSPSRPAKGFCPLESRIGSTERVFFPKFLRKFAFRKLGADSKPSYVCKTDSSCPPFLALLRGVPLRTPKRSTEMGFCLRCFYARLRCKRGRVSRPVRSELFAPFGACYSLHSERVVHSTRSVLSTPLGVCCPLHSECIIHSARSVLSTPLGVCCSLHSE